MSWRGVGAAQTLITSYRGPAGSGSSPERAGERVATVTPDGRLPSGGGTGDRTREQQRPGQSRKAATGHRPPGLLESASPGKGGGTNLSERFFGTLEVTGR